MISHEIGSSPSISGIVVDVGEAIGAVGNRGDAGAHLALGVVQQRVARRQHGLAAVFRAQRLHALHAEPVGRHLRAQIGQALARHLAVQQDQLLHVRLQLAGAIEPDRRNAQALLVDVRVAAIGEVGVVREVHRPGDDVAVDEDRLGQDDIGQMRAAAFVGVVAENTSPGRISLDRVALQDVRDKADEAAEMHRDVLGLAQRVAVRCRTARSSSRAAP